jgi:Patatin-like phospholipase
MLVLPTGFARMVEDAFSEQANELKSHSMNTAAGLHRRLLSISHVELARLRSDDTCFVCLRRRPQYGLPCGHCICDNCPRVFGERSKDDPWLFKIRTCFLCGLTTLGVEVKYLPENAGVRVLTLDGGGVRGIATLQYLKALQERIGLPYPVQENFDLVYGTSSGG